MTGGSPGTSTLRRLSEAANRGCDQRLRPEAARSNLSPDDLVEIEIEIEAIKRLRPCEARRAEASGQGGAVHDDVGPVQVRGLV
jgi:hypothetical protein